MRRILFVDDQQCELDGMVGMMDWRELGLEVAGAVTDPRQALERISAHPVDIVVTDVIMRDMDGLALVRELRRRFPDVRCVCISGFDDFRFVGPAVNEGGVSGYVLKPVRVNEMRELIRRILAELDRRDARRAPDGSVIAMVGMDAKHWQDGFDEAALSRPVRIARTELPPPTEFLSALELRAGGWISILPAEVQPEEEGALLSDPTPLRDVREAYLQLFGAQSAIAMQNEQSAVECIKENIERHLGENVGMQAILANVYFSANYANTLFKEATGMTIHQYQMQRRLSRAAQLLVDEPEVRVKDIAWRCGFSDASHLINSFRRAYGCSPDKYRRRHLRP